MRALRHQHWTPAALHPGEEWLRISIRARSAGSKKFKVLADWIRGELSRRHLEPVGVTAIPTGTSVVFGESADAIVRGQIESFLFAFPDCGDQRIVKLTSNRCPDLSDLLRVSETIQSSHERIVNCAGNSHFRCQCFQLTSDTKLEQIRVAKELTRTAIAKNVLFMLPLFFDAVLVRSVQILFKIVVITSKTASLT